MSTNPEVLNVLRALEAQHGILRPADVVNHARSETSPLHGSFEWDDSAAAEQYRLWQARQIIRVVVSHAPSDPSKEMRVFVSVTPDRDQSGGGYRSIESVMANAELRAQLLADAKADMIRFKTKYRDLSELADVFSAIDSVTGEEGHGGEDEQLFRSNIRETRKALMA